MTSQQQHAAADQPADGAEETVMRAIVQDAYGSADVLRMARIPRPTPANHEVLVRVRAAGLDRGTWALVPEAMRYFDAGKARGKIAIIM